MYVHNLQLVPYWIFITNAYESMRVGTDNRGTYYIQYTLNYPCITNSQKHDYTQTTHGFEP